MKIEKQIKEDHLILKLSGRLDTQTSSRLQETVDCIPDNITGITVDMLNLSYVSSSGLRVLLGASKLMKSRDGRVEVVNANNGIKEVFKITGFDKILYVSEENYQKEKE